MLSSENDDFKFCKTAKSIKSMCITCTIVPALLKLFYLVDQKHERKRSHRAVLCIFQNMENLDTSNFSLTLSIYYNILAIS